MSLTNNTTKLNEILDTVNSLPSAVSIDTTLTIAGKAADAKAVGDALADNAERTAVALETIAAGQTSENVAAMNALLTGEE